MNSVNQSILVTSDDKLAGAIRLEEAALDFKLIYGHFHYYYTVILVPVGITANFLSILIYSRKELNKTNAGFLNKCIGITNVIILLFHLFIIESKYLFGADLLAHSDLTCRIFRLVKKTTRECSPMIETGLILSRYFEVFRPKQFMFIYKKGFLVTTILAVYSLLFLLNSENLFYFKSRVKYIRGNVIFHEIKCTSFVGVVVLSEVISAIFRSILPSIAMLVLNILIITKLYQSRLASNRRTRPKRELKFTRTTLLRNLVFILLNLPYTIVSVFKIAFLLRDTRTNRLYMYQFDIYLRVCYDISTFYYVSFFFMNMTFNKLFRREILVILGLRLPRNRGTSVRRAPDNNSSWYCMSLNRQEREAGALMRPLRVRVSSQKRTRALKPNSL
jgi:hypothetical protein